VLSREEILHERRHAAEALQNGVHVARVAQVPQAGEPRALAVHRLHWFLAGSLHTFQANGAVLLFTRKKTPTTMEM